MGYLLRIRVKEGHSSLSKNWIVIYKELVPVASSNKFSGSEHPSSLILSILSVVALHITKARGQGK